jgi:hypothetical protein
MNMQVFCSEKFLFLPQITDVMKTRKMCNLFVKRIAMLKWCELDREVKFLGCQLHIR